jgi:hypothetical protein
VCHTARCPYETYDELKSSLSNSLRYSKNELSLLLSGSCRLVGGQGRNTKDRREKIRRLMGVDGDGYDSSTDSKITTATLRELIIRNKACQGQGKIEDTRIRTYLASQVRSQRLTWIVLPQYGTDLQGPVSG